MESKPERNAVALSQQGFDVEKGILGDDVVRVLRHRCLTLARQRGRSELFPSEFLSEHLLWRIPIQPRIVGAIEARIGPGFVLMPNFGVRIDPQTPWHIDAGFRAADFTIGRTTFLQCAVYLQANSGQNGGGIDVVPGSHVASGEQATSGGELLALCRSRITLPSEAGDLVMWDALDAQIDR
jgi:hypothetical protein